MLTGGVAECNDCCEYDPLSEKWVPSRETPFGEWTCNNCARIKNGDLDPYASKIANAYILNRAGYPFGRDDLDPDDWRMMGMLEVMLRRIELKKEISQYCKSTGMRVGEDDNGTEN